MPVWFPTESTISRSALCYVSLSSDLRQLEMVVVSNAFTIYTKADSSNSGELGFRVMLLGKSRVV